VEAADAATAADAAAEAATAGNPLTLERNRKTAEPGGRRPPGSDRPGRRAAEGKDSGHWPPSSDLFTSMEKGPAAATSPLQGRTDLPHAAHQHCRDGARAADIRTRNSSASASSPGERISDDSVECNHREPVRAVERRPGRATPQPDVHGREGSFPADRLKRRGGPAEDADGNRRGSRSRRFFRTARAGGGPSPRAATPPRAGRGPA